MFLHRYLPLRHLSLDIRNSRIVGGGEPLAEVYFGSLDGVPSECLLFAVELVSRFGLGGTGTRQLNDMTINNRVVAATR